ncbi:MAG: DUF3604 domain-containing protein [Myxococcota bacterium]|jgi:hypothetical protein|nr:DUF3604 domain-containing protein [Myxococcota bacterium]
MTRKIGFAFATLGLLFLLCLYLAGRGFFGSHEGPGEIVGQAREATQVARRTEQVREATTGIGAPGSKQILFGDFHVHTTFSFDAFMMSLPTANGEGTHPPADACDFARHCSALDFWSINDHAEQISQRNWRETIDSIQQCNEIAGNPQNPDLVSFLGWEWTDVGFTPEDHYGHKNVVLAHTDAENIPTHPIASYSTYKRAADAANFPTLGVGAVALFSGEPRLHDLARYFAERVGTAPCPSDVDVHDLPEDCLDTAATPADLFRKLDEWGVDSIVIPHGTTWGMYTPAGATWDKQLKGRLHDPNRQTLLEIYSGHGDSDVYRDWRAVDVAADGTVSCPNPTAAYLPTCWRAGEIIESRCLDDGEDPAECAERAVTARQNAAAAGLQAHLTVPGAKASDWLDAGQCKDCEQPSFNYRPGGSAQYIMAIANFDNPSEPRRFRFGFMGSSDNHFARPGTGFKEVHRSGFSESAPSNRADSGVLNSIMNPPDVEPESYSRPFNRADSSLQGFAAFEMERQGSFFMTGGLIAVHSEGRDRDSIWGAVQQREVYGTTGQRTLLWFDLINPPGTRGLPVAMGGEVQMSEAPIFQVRAVGSFEQKPGCPDETVQALGEDRLDHVCKNECYNPSDERRSITRIEVVRIRPQIQPDEPLAPLIEDPWLSFDCDPSPAGCAVTFSDPDHAPGGRDTLYYVRAMESPALAVNAAGVRCEYDESGRCLKANLCNDANDDCLAEQEPRAWSSPIFVDYGPASAGAL